jgi:hypothetical protein
MKPGNRQQDCTVLNPVGVNLEMRDDSLLTSAYTRIRSFSVFALSTQKKEER